MAPHPVLMAGPRMVSWLRNHPRSQRIVLDVPHRGSKNERLGLHFSWLSSRPEVMVGKQRLSLKAFRHLS